MFNGFIKSISRRIKFQPENIGVNLHSNRQGSLKLKDALKTLNPDDLSNFLWLSILKPQCLFNAYTLSILRKLDLNQAQESLNTLMYQRLLIQPENTEEYYMHESLRDFASHLLTSQKNNESQVTRLGVKWTDAHQKLILAFQKNNSYVIQNKEIYFCKNLDWHLQQAGWEDKIHSIISNILPLNQWKSQVSQQIVNCNFDPISLISIAENDSTLKFNQNPSENLVLLAKYMLMKNIQTHVLQNIPVQWVKILIEIGAWSETKSLGYIQSQPNAERKADCIDILKESYSTKHLEALINFIAEIKLDSARALAIKGIFEYLDTQQKKTTLLLLSEIKSEFYRSTCIGVIAPHIPVTLMEMTFTEIQSIKDQNFQAIALERILPYLTLPLKKKSLEIIRNIQDINIEFRLLSKIQETIPQVQSDILRLAPKVEADYTKLSVLWKLYARQEQTTERITTLLAECPSNLDKVLFLSDLIPVANPTQLNGIRTIVSAFEDESLWGSAIVELLPVSDQKEINAIIKKVSTLKTEEIKAELCIQIIPFADCPAQFEQIYEIIQRLKDPFIKSMWASQMLDYIPEGLSLVLNSLNEIVDPIKQLEIKISLLENNFEWGEIVLQSIEEISDIALKTQFLSQIIYLLPDHLIVELLNIILELRHPKERDSLLNQLTPRLEIDQIQRAIEYLTQEIYPTEIFKNVSKQINRNYWESSIANADDTLPQILLDQLSEIQVNEQTIRTEDILEDIFNLPTVSKQIKILSLCLNEVKWETLQPSTLLKIMTILSQGSSLEMLKNLPILTQGIQTLLGSHSLPAYGNICYQLSQPRLSQTPLTHQNKANISHIVEYQQPWLETA